MVWQVHPNHNRHSSSKCGKGQVQVTHWATEFLKSIQNTGSCLNGLKGLNFPIWSFMSHISFSGNVAYVHSWAVLSQPTSGFPSSLESLSSNHISIVRISFLLNQCPNFNGINPASEGFILIILVFRNISPVTTGGRLSFMKAVEAFMFLIQGLELGV